MIAVPTPQPPARHCGDHILVATATFRLLYALIVLSLDRRRVVHFEITQNPTQVWLSGQMTEAFPGTLRRAICCGTETNRMVRRSVIEFERSVDAALIEPVSTSNSLADGAPKSHWEVTSLP